MKNIYQPIRFTNKFRFLFYQNVMGKFVLSEVSCLVDLNIVKILHYLPILIASFFLMTDEGYNSHNRNHKNLDCGKRFLLSIFGRFLKKNKSL